MTETPEPTHTRSQSDGLEVLGAMCNLLNAQLAVAAPHLEWATVFWSSGEETNLLSNVIYSRTPNDPVTHDAIETALCANRSALHGREVHGLDTPFRVCFYEQEFYVLSNFSAFSLQWCGHRFDTSEAAYHWTKFIDPDQGETQLQRSIRLAPSAHEAFVIAGRHADARRRDWDGVKVAVMRDILRAKVDQHEYVLRKLMQTGERDLVENSWRDDFWGWGSNRDGQNVLGKLWMGLRAELRAEAAARLGSDES